MIRTVLRSQRALRRRMPNRAIARRCSRAGSILEVLRTAPRLNDQKFAEPLVRICVVAT